jgi:hypothetical protein
MRKLELLNSYSPRLSVNACEQINLFNMSPLRGLFYMGHHPFYKDNVPDGTINMCLNPSELTSLQKKYANARIYE